MARGGAVELGMEHDAHDAIQGAWYIDFNGADQGNCPKTGLPGPYRRECSREVGGSREDDGDDLLDGKLVGPKDLHEQLGGSSADGFGGIALYLGGTPDRSDRHRARVRHDLFSKSGC